MGRVSIGLMLLLCVLFLAPLSAGAAVANPAGVGAPDPSVVLTTNTSTSTSTILAVPEAMQRAIVAKPISVPAVIVPSRDRRNDPDDAGYEFRDSDEDDGPAFDWIDIVGADGAQDWELGDDQSVGAELGFDFNYYGSDYRAISLCSNGWFSFTDDEGRADYSYAGWGQLPTGDAPSGQIAALMTDILMAGGGGRGALWFWSDDETAVITWDGCLSYIDRESMYTFQAVLTSDGQIVFNYRQLDGNPGRLVGYQNADRNMGAEIARDEDYPRAEFSIAIGNHFQQFDGPGIAIRPDALDFGNVLLGGSRTMAVRITNVGGEELVITGVSCDEGAFILPQMDQELVLGPGQRFDTEVTFEPGDLGDYEGDIVIACNAENANENGDFIVRAMGRCSEAPMISVDPEAFLGRELFSGQSEELELTISNDGGVDLEWMAEIEITGEPERDNNARALRGVNDRGAGPRRDPVESRFALFKEAGGWGDQMEDIWNINEIDIDQYNSGQFDDFAIDDYDCIWIREYQSDQFSGLWNDNIERFEEWVDGGGVLYQGTGTNNWGVAPVSIGGITRIAQQYSGNGIVDISNDAGADNYSYFAELCNWQGGEGLPGNSWAHSAFNIGDFAEIEGSDWFQVIAHFEENQDYAGVAVYNYGRGFSIVSGTTDSHQYSNFPNEGQWGWALQYLPPYMDNLANFVQWISIEPEEGMVSGNDSQPAFITLNAEGLNEGDYTADIHILNNDPENADVVVPVALFVTGAPDIAADWEPGNPDMIDFNAAFPDLFNGFAYEVPVWIINEGTADLVVDGIEFSNGVYTSPQEGGFAVSSGDQSGITVVLNAEESGNNAGVMTVFSNDPDQGELNINLIGVTGSPPEFQVNTHLIEDELFTGETADHALTVTNGGEAPLRFMIEAEVTSEPGDNRDAATRSLRGVDGAAGPVRDDAGELLGQFNGNNVANQYTSCAGWDWDSEGMWVSNYSSANAVRWGHDDNYENFEEQRRIAPGNCMDGAWAKGYLYLPPWANQTVNRYNEAGQNIGAINMPYPVYGMGADVDNDWIFFINPNDGLAIYVYDLNDDGSLGENIGVIRNHMQFHGNEQVYSMEWVGRHKDGQLWMTQPSQGTVHQIAVDTDNWECTGEAQQAFRVFPQNDQPYCAVGHDGKNLWAAGYFPANIRIYDDGFSEAYWLSLSTEEGELASGESMDVNVHLDAAGLFSGEYIGEVRFFTNDPNANPEIVDVVLNVVGAPNIMVEWDEADGYSEDPDAAVVDWNMHYQDVFSGGPYDMMVTVSNEGTDVLNVSEVYTNHEYFTVDVEDFVLDAGDSRDLTITFESPADDADEFVTALHLTSDDPDQGNIDIMLHADADLPPQIVFEPDAETGIEETLSTGLMMTTQINISNVGDALLRFAVEIETISEPGDERDGNERGLRGVNGANVGPARDDAGDLLGQFNGNNAGGNYCSPVGVDAENGGMWVTNYSQNNAVRWGFDGDYQNFAEQRRIAPGNCMDGCFAMGFLYIQQLGSATVNRWNADGQNVGAINVGFPVYGSAADEENNRIFFFNINTQQIVVFHLNDDGTLGQQLGVIANHNQFHGNQVAYNLEWVDAHKDGQLWMTNYATGRVHQILVNTDNWQCVAEVQSFPVFPQADQPYCGVAHDGENLWAAGLNPANIRIYDDGNAEVSWLTVVPTEGVVEGGGDTNLDVMLDATGLMAGDYVGVIIFSTNDPSDPTVNYPVVLHMEEAADIAVTWPDEFGFEENRIDFNAAFADLYWGGPYEVEVEVENTGVIDLEVDGFFCNEENGFFYVSEENESFVVGPGETRAVPIIFFADEAGDYNGTFTVSNTSVRMPELTFDVHAQAFNPPMAVLSDDSYSSELFTGQQEEFSFTLSNEGDADLRFTTEVELTEPERDATTRALRSVNGGEAGPVRDPDAGELIAQFNGNNVGNQYSSCVGWDWDNEGMWVSNYSSANAVRWGVEGNYAGFPEQRRIAPGNCMDGAWAKGLLYLPPWANPTVNRYNAAGQNIGAINMPYPVYGMGADVENDMLFFINPNDGLAIYVYHVNDDGSLGAQLGVIRNHQQFHGNQAAYNMEWVPKHPAGQLWMTNYTTGMVHQISVNTENWQCTGNPVTFRAFPQADQPYCAVGHDGHNMWASGFTPGNIRIYHDGNTEAYWFNYEPAEGTIAAEQSADIFVMLDATGLIGGRYVADLYFNSNDPTDEGRRLRHQTILDVTGIGDILVEWPDAAGFPNEMNWNGVYQDELYARGPYPIAISITNEGTEDIEITDVFGDDIFTTDWNVDNQSILGVGEEIVINAIFEAPEADVYEGMITIESTDPDEEVIEIICRAECTNPPEIILSEESNLGNELRTGDIEEFELTISNDGEAALRWVAEIEITQEPERDADGRSLRTVDGSVAGPVRDDAGEVLGQFAWNRSAQNQYKGNCYDWDNEVMMLSAYSPNWLAIVDPADGYRVIREWQPGGNPMGVAWLEGTFYAVLWANQFVGRYDVNGQNLGNFQVNVQTTSITASQELGVLFLGDGAGNRDIYVTTPQGQRVGTIARATYGQFMGNQQQRSLCWVDKHPDGQLWMNSPGRIWQVHVNTDNWRADAAGVNWATGAPNAQEWDGIGHDKFNIIYSSYGLPVFRIYDDGITEAYWLNWETTEGEVQPGGDQVVTYELNATGAVGGDYAATVHFISNDPVAPGEESDVDFPITMTVTGIPLVDATPGGPEEGEGPMDFGIVYFGYPEDHSVMVENVGTDDLEIFDVIPDENNGDFSVNPDAYDGVVIGIGEAIELPITWNPTEENGEGEVTATLMLITNDPNFEENGYPVRLVGMALVAPDLDLEDNVMEEDLDEGESVERTFNLANVGGSNIDWAAEFRNMREPERDANARSLRNVDGSEAGPMRDNPGDLIAQFNGNNVAGQYSSCVGWDWDNEGMWVSNYSSANAVRWGIEGNYAGFPEQRRIAPGNCMDGAWAKGLLYLPNWANAACNRYNAAGQNIGAINMPYPIYGMAADVENDMLFFINPNDGLAIYVYHVNDDGSLGANLGVIRNHQQFHGNQAAYSMEWVPKHPDGQLWMTNYTTGMVHQIAVNTENWQCTGNPLTFRVFPQADQPYCAVGHDGHNLWASGLNPANIRIYDDGNLEAYWLMLEPMEGTIGAESDTDVIITFSTEGAIGGHYEADIVFMSNDPRDPEQTLTVSLDIHGRSFWMSDPAAMGEEGIDASTIEFSNTFVDGESASLVTIANSGSEAFRITNVWTEGGNPDDFGTNFDGETVVPTGDEVEFWFFFRPSESGQRSSTVYFETDAMNIEGGVASWDVTGFGEVGPDMYTVPEGEVPMEFAAVDDDESFTTDFIIGNRAGDNRADLEWAISSMEVEEERDGNARGLRNVDGRIAGPRRDAPEGRLAFFNDGQDGWGNFNAIWQQEQVDMTQYGSNAFGNAPIEEFDMIWIREYQSDAFNTAWNNNRARFEEWVDAGGVIYHCVGTNNWAVVPIHVGGIRRNQQGDGNGQVVVSNDPDAANYNYLAELMNWRGNEGLNGNAWSHASYTRANFDNAENSDWYQAIAIGQGGQVDRIGVGVYNYGRGFSVISGTTDSHQYNNWRGQAEWWGNAIPKIPYYLSFLANQGLPWLEIDPTDGTIPEGQETVLQFTYNHAELEEGDYFGTLLIESNDPNGLEVMIPISFHKGAPPDPIHFVLPDPTGSSSSMLVTGVTFDGEAVPSGWEVGVFTPDDVLAGSMLWRGAQDGIAVWGSDDDHDYFEAGQTMSLRLWDNDADMEWPGRANLEEGDMVWRPDGLTILSIDGFSAKTLQVAFRNGWNLISINVAPTDQNLWAGDPGPEIVPMMAQFARPNGGAHHVLLMKNERGLFYVPSRGFNGIPYWNLAEGYQVRVDEALNGEWTGVPIDPQANVPITRGWNMIAYFPDYQLLASRASRNYVVSPIINSVVIAKDGLGNFMIPSRDFFSNMPPWREGLGYQINVSQDVVLNYPMAQNQGANLAAKAEVNGHWAEVTPTGSNMSVLITKIAGVKLAAGDQVAAFNKAGNIVGVGNVIDGQIGLAVWGDDASTDAVEGLAIGEIFTLKLWNSATSEIVELGATLLEGDKLEYVQDGFSVISASVLTVPTEYSLGQNYPNPFNAVTRIAFGLPEASRISVRVFDLSGREVSTLVSGELKAGHHSVVMNGEDMVSGVYIVKMEAANFSAVRKVMLVK